MKLEAIIFDFHGVILKTSRRNVLLGETEYVPYQDSIDFIRSLPSNVRLGIGSSSDSTSISQALDLFKIDDHFQAVVGADNVQKTKPGSDVYDKAMLELGVTQLNSVVIEDSPVGIEAAKSAGLICIAVARSYDHESLNRADLIVNSLNDLTIEKILELF